MKTRITLLTESGTFLESISVKMPIAFIMYRGFLYERKISDVKKPEYVQRQYLEIS